MFNACKNFNQNLNCWNVQNVNNMTGMFNKCDNFNQDLSNWDVSNITNMNYMFAECTNFNKNLSSWKTKIANVWTMERMFYNTPITLDTITTIWGWNLDNIEALDVTSS